MSDHFDLVAYQELDDGYMETGRLTWEADDLTLLEQVLVRRLQSAELPAAEEVGITTMLTDIRRILSDNLRVGVES
jgi:hypothetical protein